MEDIDMGVAPKARQEFEGEGFSDEMPEMVVLDPEHELLEKFQQTLKALLIRQNEEANAELYELDKAVKDKEREKEEFGVNLYGLQKELSYQKTILNNIHDSYKKLNEEQKDIKEHLEFTKTSHKSLSELLKQERKKELDLRHDMEDIAIQVVQLTALQEETYGDSSVMKRAAQKLGRERIEMQLDKMRQDLYIHRLEETAYQLREKIALLKAQCRAKKEESRALRQQLTEANTEMQVVHYEKQQLTQNWRNSIQALSQRDEASARAREDVRYQHDLLSTLHADVLGHKKSIRKELERNEELSLHMNHQQSEIARLKKNIKDSLNRQSGLQQQYSFYDRTVQETDKNLEETNIMRDNKYKELNELAKKMEKSHTEKRMLEDAIMEKMQEKLAMTKATQYAQQMIRKIRATMQEMEMNMGHKENEVSKQNLDIINITAQMEQLQDTLNKLNEEIGHKNDTIQKTENEISKGHILLEKRQTVVSELNRKLDQLISSAGGLELGPLEREKENMKKEIILKEDLSRNLERQWLRQQGELVSLTNEATARIKEVDIYSKKLAVLGEKKIRLDADISNQEKEIKDVEKRIGVLQNDVLRLNTLLHEEKGLQQRLEQETDLLKSDYVKVLKEAELDCLQKEHAVDNIKTEKERLTNLLIEAEHEVVLWEGKLSMAQETKKVLKSDTNREEIQELKSEVRKLQVYLNQLKKEQENLIQQLDKEVTNYGLLFTKMEIQMKRGKRKDTKQSFARKEDLLKKKVKQIKKDVDVCDEKIKTSLMEQSDITTQIEALHQQVSLLNTEISSKDEEISNRLREKFKNFITLTLKQQKTKYYQAVKDGKYTVLIKTEGQYEMEAKKIKEHLESMRRISEELRNEYPELAEALNRAEDYISCAEFE